MEVIEAEGKFWVAARDQRVAGPFETNAQAWRWVGNDSEYDRGHSDRYNQIRMAFNGSLIQDRY